jgi:stearoyl-CoA desaturase (delta-9 desaturase)
MAYFKIDNKNDADNLSEETKDKETIDNPPYVMEIAWTNVALFALLHGVAFLCVFQLPRYSWYSLVYQYGIALFSGIGVTGGVHRLWCHRSYKARFPLRLVLALGNTIAGQSSIYNWTHVHRTHHKHSDTDADPTNSRRGWFFAHMGCYMVKPHPDVIKAIKTTKPTDLDEDPIVVFQHKYYVPLFVAFGFILPSVIPHLLWNESLIMAFLASNLRYVLSLHFTWTVNSFAHWRGMKPYDKTICPSENMLVTFLALGEGFHNFHHTWPYDYRASEWGFKFNITTAMINAMAMLDLAYDLRTASLETISDKANKKGDISLTAGFQQK